jgi:hypothetical protein
MARSMFSWLNACLPQSRPTRRRSSFRAGPAAACAFSERLESRLLMTIDSVVELETLSDSGDTGHKPQSKVWQHDGEFFAVLEHGGDMKVMRLDGEQWNPVLTLTEGGYLADVKAVGNVAHVLLEKDADSLLASIQYAASGSYEFWSARPELVPVPIASAAETATIDIDSTGRIWAAYDNSGNVEVVYSDGVFTDWSSPIVLETGIASDDIVAVIAMPGGEIGVFWSNQKSDRFGFRVHQDGADPENWSDDEVPASQSALDTGAGMADDHLNLAVASDGTLYAAVKTSYDTGSTPTISLLVRRPDGTWDDLYEVDPGGTRPVVQISESTDTLIVAYRRTDSSGPILYRESRLSQISFGPALEAISSSSPNNVSGMKANFTDKVVLVAGSSSKVFSVRFATSGTPGQSDDDDQNETPPTQNLPPQVFAGEDQQVIGSHQVSLAGVVSDDGLPMPPGQLSIGWSSISGPGVATFSDPLSPTATVSFSTPGTYLLQLSAHDGQYVASDLISVVVWDQPDLSIAPVTASFQDGVSNGGTYSGTVDTYISSGKPTNSYGTVGGLEVDSSPAVASLIRWDVSSIAPGIQVTGASITLNVTNGSSNSFAIYQMLQSWSEVATWNEASPGVAWSAPGADSPSDRSNISLATVTGTTGSRTFHLNAAGLAVVQSWIDNPSSNHGIIIQNFVDGSNGMDFSSREASNAGRRPQLSITYEPMILSHSEISSAPVRAFA